MINGSEGIESSELDSESEELDLPANTRRANLENCNWSWNSEENIPVIHQFNAHSGVSEPKQKKTCHQTSTKLKIGEHQIWSANNIICVKWRDNKDVYFLSSKHERRDLTVTEKLKRKKGQLPREDIKKPRLCLEYQNGMKGVDFQDQVTALFPIMRRTVKGYRKIFFYILDICLFNSYIVHQALVNKRTHFKDFRIAIERQLLESINLPDYKVRGRPSNGTTTLRLQAKNWAHFPMRIPETANKKNPSKRCFVCYQNKKRREVAM